MFYISVVFMLLMLLFQPLLVFEFKGYVFLKFLLLMHFNCLDGLQICAILTPFSNASGCGGDSSQGTAEIQHCKRCCRMYLVQVARPKCRFIQCCRLLNELQAHLHMPYVQEPRAHGWNLCFLELVR
jgi:hypothetical protein